MKYLLSLVAIVLISSFNTFSQNKKSVTSKKTATDTAKSQRSDALQTSLFNGIKFRSIGPGLVSGRIADIAVNPNNHSEYYVAAANGGVWKTVNAGVTYTPLFDNEGSCSIGCVSIDPKNTNVVWVGTGENNN